MKKLIYLIAIIPLLWGCGEELENQQPYSGPDYLRFANPTTSATELTGTVRIPVVTSVAGALSATVTVEVENGVQGEDFTVSSTTLDFPEGVYSDTLEITIIDNQEADGNKIVTLSLTPSIETVALGFPNDVQNLGTNVLTIVDDDCPLDLSEFVGTFDVDEDNGAFTYTASVSLGANPNTLLVDNWWGSGIPAEVTFDNSDPANPIAYVLPQDTEVPSNGATIWVTSRPDPNASSSAPARAGVPDGSFSTCGVNFEVDIIIYIPTLGTFNGGSPVNHVFTKAE